MLPEPFHPTVGECWFPPSGQEEAWRHLLSSLTKREGKKAHSLDRITMLAPGHWNGPSTELDSQTSHTAGPRLATCHLSLVPINVVLDEGHSTGGSENLSDALLCIHRHQEKAVRW